ncbi:MAG: antibiotic biosynthesis monooxygenase [Solirubrobacterales bacterium]
MILERAQIDIRPGLEPAFEEALVEARKVISRSAGFRSLRALRGIERPGTYLLAIEWETLEDHTEGFRGSELFTRWRELLGPYFESPPEVEHFDPVEGETHEGEWR